MNNSDILNLVLEGIILCTGVPLFFVKEPKIRKIATYALLAAGSVFVVLMLSATSARRGGGSGPSQAVMDVSQVEFSMRMDGAFSKIGESEGASKLLNARDKPDQKLKENASKTMGKALAKAPGDLRLQFENAVLAGELGKSLGESINALQKNTDKRGVEAARVIDDLYVRRHLPANEVDSTITLVNDLLKPGWFKEITQLETYRVAGAKERATEAQKAYDDSCTRFLYNLIGLVLAGISAVLIGLLVLLCQLFILPRNPTGPAELSQVRSPVDYGWVTVAGVFVGWLVIEGVIGQIMAGLHFTPLKDPVPVLVPLVTMALYLLTNGPALLLVWLLALRPNNIGFAEGVKLFFRTASKGPVGLVFTGFMTWFACVPLVLLSQVSKFFGNAEGSSNPILAVIMNSAHHADIFTGLLFVLAVGVLPGICEEILFRGFLYTYLRRHFGAFVSMLLSAALFAAVHLDGGAFLQLFVLGFVFAFTLERSRSILPCIIAHALWNSSTFLIILLLFGS